ncbi:MAG: Rieske 2Fe-2S domain-containing protein [Bacteroidota bacterium]|nr:Rieske 2Fe-2S domain-containing protein [Candidatus Kapabacteria bacterium]MDW8219873.1 Rieske 2Fe-2S domain-containing protein [Bacteroidota bacterium]
MNSIRQIPDKQHPQHIIVGTRNRREFLRNALALSIFAVGGSTHTLLATILPDDIIEKGSTLTSTYTMRFSDFPVLRNVNGSVRVQVPGAPLSLGRIIVTRLSMTEFSALSELCTHASCPVDPFMNGRFTCQCHGSVFDGRGRVLVGPATRPLLSFTTTYRSGDDFVQITIPGLVTSSVLGESQTSFSLGQNFPNPTSGQTTIEYNVERQSMVTITLLSILGKEISELVRREHEPGVYRVTTDVSNLSRGVYLYRMETSTGFTQTRKLTVI